MTDDRTRWPDDRLDDAFTGIRDSLDEIKSGVTQLKSDELQRLRDAITGTEIANAKLEARTAETKARRFNFIAALITAGLGAAISTTIGLLLSGIIH